MHSTALDWNHRPVQFHCPVLSGFRDRTTALLFTHLAILSILIAAGLLERAAQVAVETLLYPCCAVLTLAFVWVLGSWYWLRGTFFEPYPLFMTAAGLFNGGQAFLEIVNLNPNGLLDGRSSPEHLVPALYLVTISLLATHTGALLAARRSGGLKTVVPLHDFRRQNVTRAVGWILLAVAAIPTFLLLESSISIVLDYGYVWLYRRDESISVIWALAGFLVPGIMFLLAGAQNRRGIQVFCLALACVYGAINLFLGTRAAMVMSAVSIAWVFERVWRRIPRALMVLSMVLALVVLAWVRETRGTNARWRVSLADQIETLGSIESPIASSISEMGYSLVTVTHTLALVPAVREFDNGVSYLYAASTILPNLGWEVHPGKAHGLLCDWLTETVEPMVAASGGGLGYSFIAEAYLNFGWIGGPLWLLVLGYLFSRIFLLADGSDPAKLALVASFFCSFLVFARGESAMVVRGLVWYAVVPYLLVAAVSIRRVPRERRS